MFQNLVYTDSRMWTANTGLQANGGVGAYKSSRRSPWANSSPTKGGNGFQGNCNYCGKIRPPLERVLGKGPRLKAKGGGLWTQREEERDRKDRDSTLTVNSSTLDRGGVAVQDGKQREEQKGVPGKEEKGKGYPGKGGAYWFDGVSAQGVDVTGGEVWHAVSSNQWRPKLFLMESAPPGLELKNSFAALDERGSDDPIPLVSVEDFPAMSAETVFEKKCVPRVGKLRKRHKHSKRLHVGRGQVLCMK